MALDIQITEHKFVQEPPAPDRSEVAASLAGMTSAAIEAQLRQARHDALPARVDEIERKLDEVLARLDALDR